MIYGIIIARIQNMSIYTFQIARYMFFLIARQYFKLRIGKDVQRIASKNFEP